MQTFPFTHRWLRRYAGWLALALLLPLVLPASPAAAEGSRELTDSGGGHRPYTEYRGPVDAANGSFNPNTGTPSGLQTDYYYGPSSNITPRSIVGDIEPDTGVGFPSFTQSVTGSLQRRTLVYVYAQQGETILLGSSSVGSGVGVDTDAPPPNDILTDCAITGDTVNAVGTDPAVFCGAIGFVPPGFGLAGIRFFDPVNPAQDAYPANATNFPSYTGQSGFADYPQPGEPCGRIDTYAEEVGVANMVDGVTQNPGTGYNACIISVDGTDANPYNDPGLYEIHLIPATRFQEAEEISNPPAVTVDADWEDSSNYTITDFSVGQSNPVRNNIPADESGEPRYDTPYTTAWEVQVLRAGADPFFYDYPGASVGPSDGNDVAFGRVFVNYYALNMGANDVQLDSRFFVYTDKGARYLIDLNQLDPFGFLFFSNNKGNVDLTTGNPIYRTLQMIGSNVGQIYPDAGANPIPAGNRVNNYGTHPPTGFDPDEWTPGEPTTLDRNVTNKLFLRQISDDIPATIDVADVGSSYGPQTTWGNVDYEEPDLPSFLFPLPTPPLPANTFIPNVETLQACSVAPTCPTFPADARGPDYTTGNKPAFIYRPKDAGPGPGDTVPGGYFFFTNVDNTGALSSYRIVIDTDNDGTFGNGNDRVLIGQVAASPTDGEQVVNVVEWDGLDEAGNQLAETDLIRARIFFQAGEIHFPMIDPEQHTGQNSGTFVHRLRPVDDDTISPELYPATIDPNITPEYINYTTLYYDNRYTWINSGANESAPGSYDFSPCAGNQNGNGSGFGRNGEDWQITYGTSSNNPDMLSPNRFDSRCQGVYPATRATSLSGTFDNPRYSLASVFGVPGGTGANAVNNEPALGVLQYSRRPADGFFVGFGNQRAIDLWTNVNYTIAEIGPNPTSVSLLGVQATSTANALPGVAAAGLALLALCGAAATLRLRRRRTR